MTSETGGYGLRSDRTGTPSAQQRPPRRRRFVTRPELAAAAAALAPTDADAFRTDIDLPVDPHVDSGPDRNRRSTPTDSVRSVD